MKRQDTVKSFTLQTPGECSDVHGTTCRIAASTVIATFQPARHTQYANTSSMSTIKCNTFVFKRFPQRVERKKVEASSVSHFQNVLHSLEESVGDYVI